MKVLRHKALTYMSDWHFDNSNLLPPAGLHTLLCPDTAVCAQDEVSSLKGKLEECKAQLQSNEQMIRWLNNQV